jgi:hypothetical protein
MSKVVTTTLLPDVAGGTVTLGGTGDSVVATGNDLRTNVLQDAGGNAVLTSNGSGVLSGMNSGFGGALNLLSTQTASGASSVSFTSDIDDTYDVYVFKFIEINPASQSSFQFQTSTNSGSSYGVTVTSTYFRGQHTETGNGGALGYQTTLDQAQTTNDPILLHDQSADADSGGAGELYLFSPSSTTYVKHFYSRNVNFSPSSSYQAYIFDAYIGGYFNTTTAIDAIIFRCSTGNFDGTIKLYGISKS